MGSITNCFAAPLEEIPWIDNPEIKVSRVESVEMPFRYVKGKNGEITVPEVNRKTLPSCSLINGLTNYV
jgi:ribosome biogenesis SPOUT family RNA methylase Rps3